MIDKGLMNSSFYRFLVNSGGSAGGTAGDAEKQLHCGEKIS